MNVNVGRVVSAETPASTMQGEIVEHLASIMIFCGIEGISVEKRVCGYGSRLVSTISPFDGVPENVFEQGVVIKDAIAQIMSIANLNRIIVETTDEDLQRINSMWDRSVRESVEINHGSSQDFESSESTGE